MYGVGAIEIVAGLGILLLQRIAPYVVAGWLGGIITNTVIKSIAIGGHTQVFWDIALRDLGLLVAALALARLAPKFAPQRFAQRFAQRSGS
jgi:sulfite exporter TauE/SafE